MRLGIRPQAALTSAVPLVFLLLLLGLATALFQQTDRTLHLTSVVTDSEQIVETIARANAAVADYGRTRDAADIAKYRNARDDLAGEERDLRGIVGGEPRLTALSDAYVRNTAAAFAIMDEYVAAVNTGNRAAVARVGTAPKNRAVGIALEASLTDLNRAAQAQARIATSARRASLLRLEAVLVACAAAGIVLTVVVAVAFGVRIVRRLSQLGENARRLAEGEPVSPVTGTDEISRLDAVYRLMADRIEGSARAHQEALEKLQRERDVTTMLQQSLLPGIPSIPGVRIDTAYETATEGTRIGGDWFDVFVCSERHLALSVGDVTGHGLEATAAMGFVRQAIRVAARIDGDPALVMQRVNDVVCEEKSTIVSAFFGIYDREDGTLRYAIAGHGPPMLIGVDGTATLLAGEGMILGVEPRVRYVARESALRPGDTIVLYTDGIVEVERDYLKGMRDLEEAVRAECARPSSNLALGIQRRIFADRAPLDDSALLAVRVLEFVAPAEGPRSQWWFDARDPDTSRRTKREVLEALAALGAPAPDPGIAEVIYGELISNVVRHTPGPARVTLSRDGDRVVLTVEDRAPIAASAGRNGNGSALSIDGMPDEAAESGRGLFIIRMLSRGYSVEPTANGKATQVVLPLLEASDPKRVGAAFSK